MKQFLLACLGKDYIFPKQKDTVRDTLDKEGVPKGAIS